MMWTGSNKLAFSTDHVIYSFLTGNMSNPDECAICMESLPNLQLPCHSSHIFHKTCIDHWMEKNASCPLCRAVVGKASELHPCIRYCWCSCCFISMIILYVVVVVYVSVITACIVTTVFAHRKN